MSKRPGDPGYAAQWCIHYRAPKKRFPLKGRDPGHDDCEAGVPLRDAGLRLVDRMTVTLSRRLLRLAHRPPQLLRDVILALGLACASALALVAVVLALIVVGWLGEAARTPGGVL